MLSRFVRCGIHFDLLRPWAMLRCFFMVGQEVTAGKDPVAMFDVDNDDVVGYVW